jgi:membrane-bound serine protease (ClpP class)
MIELSFPLVLLCLAAGILLLAIEVFLTPGAMIKGVLGLLLIATAVIIAFTQHGPERGSLVLGLALAVLVGGGWVAKATMGRRLVLRDHVASDPALETSLATLVGQRGVALSALRPSGIARFGDVRVDVTCESEFVDANTPVVVASVNGNRVVVKRG